MTEDWPPEYVKQPLVKLPPGRVLRFMRAAAEVRGDAREAPVQLPVMEEPETRRQKGDDGRGLVDPRGEGGRCPGLVVVFQKASQFVLGV